MELADYLIDCAVEPSEMDMLNQTRDIGEYVRVVHYFLLKQFLLYFSCHFNCMILFRVRSATPKYSVFRRFHCFLGIQNIPIYCGVFGTLEKILYRSKYSVLHIRLFAVFHRNSVSRNTEFQNTVSAERTLKSSFIVLHSI